MTDAQRRLLTQMVEREEEGWLLGYWIRFVWVRGPTRKPAEGTEVNGNTTGACLRRGWVEVVRDASPYQWAEPTLYRTTEAGRGALKS